MQLKAIATDCEDKWEAFVTANQDMRDEGRLFRFTASGLENVALDEAGQKNLIADRTNSYLERGSTKEELGNCKKALLCQETSVKDNQKTSASLQIAPSNIPFKRNANFVGREPFIHKLQEKLSSGESCQSVALWGLGGTGKTQIALEYAFRRKMTTPGCAVFWIPAISLDTLNKAYFEIGKLLNIPGISDEKADVKILVQNKLSDESSGEWLIIVDNADDTGVLFKKTSPETKRLFDFLPSSSKGSILFTTRTRTAAFDQVQAYDNLIEVTEMRKPEARDLLKKILGEKALLQDSEAVDKLLSLLAHLPLAIVQATSYISCNDIRLAQYISMFEEGENHTVQMLSEDFEDRHRYQDQQMKNPIATTWLISFERIQEENPLAANYLKYMACLLRDNIPQALLPKHESQNDLVKAVGTLTAYSFLTKQENPQMFDMHRLVHLVTRNWLKSQNQLAPQTKIALSRVSEVLPFGNHIDYNIWVEYLPHAIYLADSAKEFAEWEARAHLLDNIGRCQQRLGQYEAAEKTQRQLLELRTNRLGKEHASTLISGNEVGLALHSQGKYAEAEEIYRETLAIGKKAWGKEHPYSLAVRNNLGQSLINQGKNAEAEMTHRETLALKEKVLGKEHTSTLISRNEVGKVLDYQGKFGEAEDFLQETLALREKVSGVEHPETLIVRNNLGLSLSNQGKYPEAERAFREALALKEKVLGNEHPSTLISRNNLRDVVDMQKSIA